MEKKKQELEAKIEELERNKIAYLEVDNKAAARRIEKQIEKLEMKIELLELNKIKRELEVYKEVIRQYPDLQNLVKKKLEVI